MELSKNSYDVLLDEIGTTLILARTNAVCAINTELVIANWKIGRHIVEFEQHGKERAEYGKELLVRLSADLKNNFGKGFSRSNLQLMRQFYVKYPNFIKSSSKSEIRPTVSGELEGKRQTLSGRSLSWSHYAELVTVSDDLARSFYEKQAASENWSFRGKSKRDSRESNQLN